MTPSASATTPMVTAVITPYSSPSGPIDPVTGMVTNLADLDAFAEREMFARFDHANLNTLECFLDLVPTTENLAIEIWRMFAEYPHATLERVRVEDASNNSFDHSGAGSKPTTATSYL